MCGKALVSMPSGILGVCTSHPEMKLRQAILRLFRQGKTAERAPTLAQDEKARQTEQLIQAGLAANKFPPR